jgi:hypothetical protein
VRKVLDVCCHRRAFQQLPQAQRLNLLRASPEPLCATSTLALPIVTEQPRSVNFSYLPRGAKAIEGDDTYRVFRIPVGYVRIMARCNAVSSQAARQGRGSYETPEY